MFAAIYQFLRMNLFLGFCFWFKSLTLHSRDEFVVFVIGGEKRFSSLYDSCCDQSIRQIH